MALVLIFAVINILLIYELNVLYRIYREEVLDGETQMPWNLLITGALLLYVVFNILVNMYYAIRVDSSIKAVNDLPVVLLPEWRYCAQCQLNAPPRSFHCFICEVCVMKRSNHCTMLGKCCGYWNGRFYYLFIFYSLIGAMLCNFINAEYLIELMHGFNSKILLATFMPFLAWIFGTVDNLKLMSVFANTLCVFLSIALFFYLVINMRLVFNGQTWHEYGKNVNDYNGHWFDNFVEVFGQNWLLAIFWPFCNSKLPGDGRHFKRVPEELRKNSLKRINPKTI